MGERERELEGRSLESEYQIFEFVISEVTASVLPKTSSRKQSRGQYGTEVKVIAGVENKDIRGKIFYATFT